MNASKGLISTYFPSDFNRLGYVSQDSQARMSDQRSSGGKLIFEIAFQLIFKELSPASCTDRKSIPSINTEGCGGEEPPTIFVII